MEKLHGCADLDRARPSIPTQPRGEQDEQGPKSLASASERVLADFRDERRDRTRCVPERHLHLAEVVFDKGGDRIQLHRHTFIPGVGRLAPNARVAESTGGGRGCQRE